MKKIILSFLLLTLLVGCDRDIVNEVKKTNAINTEIGLLPQLVSLPIIPVDVKWQANERVHGGAGNLIVLLHYTSNDYDYIVSNSNAFESPNSGRLDAETFDNWIPQSLRETIKANKMDGFFEFVGIMPLQPNLFTKTELSPFVSGSVIPLGDGYILVSLYSM